MQPEITSWREAGSASAPVVMLLHSIATQGAVWAQQVAVWSSSFRLIVPDLPGHGASVPRASIRTLDAYADALAQLLDDVGAARPIVVGLSLGGMIAQVFALRHPGGLRACGDRMCRLHCGDRGNW
jgi:3-oxoadipate enol-lactonase